MAEPTLEEIQQRHPDWDVHRMPGIFLAVPAGTPVVRASYASTLEEKLAGLKAAGGLVIPDPGCECGASRG